MKKAEKIREGLEYSYSMYVSEGADDSFLSRNDNSVSLTCRFSGFSCSDEAADSPVTHEIAFTFHNGFLEGFSTQEEFNNSEFPLYQQNDICCNTQMILHEIINCSFTGAFRNMFLESKALSLLLCFRKCSTTKAADCGSCKFLSKPVEKEKILKAKEILLGRLNNPPTIQELSLEIGINQCYLKKGFKEIFSTTVYDFIQEQRMLKAKMLLATTDFSIARVADEIGFSSASNFSSAFRKFTGIFPSEFQQN